MKKLVSFVLFICSVFVFYSGITAFGTEKTAVSGTDYIEIKSPYYWECDAQDFDAQKFEHAAVYSDPVYVETLEEAGEILRGYFKEKVQPVVYYRANDYLESDVTEIYNYAIEHTGEPDEGDYILWNMGGSNVNVSYRDYGSYCDITLIFNTVYYTDSDMEDEIDEAVEDVLEELDLEDKSDYEKIKAIYDYICTNVEYDHENLEDEEYKLKYTTYAAIINKKAVCQGYASLFYRLALESGIDARLIPGTTEAGRHGWNIVQLGNYYYNLDSTGDSGRSEYSYFLKCESDFTGHTRDAKYDTAAFHKEYPMSESNYKSLIASGYCGGEGDGKNLSWVLTGDGTLTISGEGAMDDYNDCGPWKEYSDQLKTLVIEEGVTSIGKYAFEYCTCFKGDLVIPDSVTKIGDYAFYGCSGFTGDLIIGDGVISIGNYAFNRCSGFAGELILGNNVTTIGNYTFTGSSGFTKDLYIPKSVTSIGYYAFNGVGIANYYFEGDVPNVLAGGFEANFDTLYYPLGNDTWEKEITNGKWKGYTVIAWDENVIAYGNCGGESGGKNLSWVITKDGTLIISGSGKMNNYNRKTVDGKTFTAAPWGEYISIIKNLVIEDNVTSIGRAAFNGCSELEGEIVIPESVTTIGEYAFFECGINDYRFKNDAPTTGANAFDADSDTIYYLDGTSWEIVDGKWNGYNAVKYYSIIDSGYCGGEGDGKNLSWVLTGDGTIKISGSGKMKNYHYKTFESSNLYVSPWAEYSDIVTKIVFEGEITTIGDYAFYEFENVEGELLIPGTVESIGNGAFIRCTGITGELILPEAITSIGDSVFLGCTGLNGELVLPEGIKTIGENAFSGCTGFTGDIIIPDSVTKLGGSAFKNCTGFNGTLYIGTGLKIMTREVFSGCTGLTGSVIFSENINNISDKAFYNCGIDSYYFMGDAPEDVTALNDSNRSFDADDVIHYFANKTSWEVENGLWNGYTAVASMIGDINEDGIIDVEDTYIARLIAAKVIVPNEWQKVLAEVDGDGKITALDANYIRRYAIHDITGFPIENGL